MCCGTRVLEVIVFLNMLVPLAVYVRYVCVLSRCWLIVVSMVYAGHCVASIIMSLVHVCGQVKILGEAPVFS